MEDGEHELPERVATLRRLPVPESSLADVLRDAGAEEMGRAQFSLGNHVTLVRSGT